MQKTIKSYLISFFMTFQVVFAVYLLFTPSIAFSAEDLKFTPSVTIPGSSFIRNQVGADFSDPKSITTTAMAQYIQAIYKYLIGIVGILATVMMMVGGFTWMTAGGSSDKVSQGKSIIISSITGLVLALTSYLMLATINPKITTIESRRIKAVQPLGCCEQLVTDNKCGLSTKAECKGTWKEGGYSCSLTGKCVGNHENAEAFLYDNPESQRCSSENGRPIAISQAGFGNNADVQKGCRDICQNSTYTTTEYKSGTQSYVCCKCTGAITGGEYSTFCATNLGTYDKCVLSNSKSGYCHGTWCLPCKSIGQSCGGTVFLDDYTCCSGDCVDNPGIGTGNSCK